MATVRNRKEQECQDVEGSWDSQKGPQAGGRSNQAEEAVHAKALWLEVTGRTAGRLMESLGHSTAPGWMETVKTASSLAPLKPPDWRGHLQRPRRERDAQRAPPGPAPPGAFTAQVHTSEQVSLQMSPAPALRTSQG